MEKKFVKINIVDNDNGLQGERIMDTYILVIPLDEYTHWKEKLKELQEMLDNRFEEENEFNGEYGAIHNYILENFEVLNISDCIDIEW